MFEGLSLPERGPVNICRRLQEDFCECSYLFAKDGRMSIRKGWDVFLANNNLKVGMGVVMAFKMVSDVLTIYFEILDRSKMDDGLPVCLSRILLSVVHRSKD